MTERIYSYDFIKSTVSLKKHVPVRIGAGLMTIEFKDRDFKSVNIDYSDFNYESEKRKEEFLDYFSDGENPYLHIETEATEKFMAKFILVGSFAIEKIQIVNGEFSLKSDGKIEYHFEADQEFWDAVRLYENLKMFFKQ